MEYAQITAPVGLVVIGSLMLVGPAVGMLRLTPPAPP
jgi:hypothetical protein